MSEIVPLLREFLTKEQLAAELGRNPRTLDGTRLARGHHGPSWAAKCFIGKPAYGNGSRRKSDPPLPEITTLPRWINFKGNSYD
jgi:hypothetical protein